MKQFKNNSNGFTIVELMVTVSMISVIVLASVTFMNYMTKSALTISDKSSKMVFSILLENTIKQDFLGSRISLNNLNMKDKNNRNFYDFILGSYCDTPECQRHFRLSTPSIEGQYSNNSFYILSTNERVSQMQRIDPIKAYSTSANGIQFVSLNKNQSLEVGIKYPSWAPKKLVYLFSPNTIKVKDSISGLNLYKSHTYLGWVNENGSGSLIKEDVDNLFSFKHPDPETNFTFTNEDIYLQNLPYIVGVGTYVFIVRAQIIRYRLKAIKNGNFVSGNLIREEKRFDGTFSERIVGENILHVDFIRNSIASPVIEIKPHFKITF